MKQLLFLTILALQCTVLSAQEVNVPDELKPYIMPGYEAMDIIKSDLNKDSLDDYILVLKVIGEDTMTFDDPNWETSRPLILIVREKNGKISAAGENSRVVLCRLCGGMMGDPYQGIMIQPGEFSVELSGGSSWRWNTNYTFKHDPLRKTWFLQSNGTITFNAGDPSATTVESMVNRSEIGDIKLEHFRPDYLADSSIYVVSSPKAFFYTSPQLHIKPKKAYIVKGDKVTAYKKLKNFVECYFTNAKGITTTGYILLKDLELAEEK